MLKIAPDKWKHFFVGLAMGLLFQAFAWWIIPAHIFISIILVLLLIIAISYGFELFSKFTGRGHYEVMDAVAAVAGGILGMGLILLVQVIT